MTKNPSEVKRDPSFGLLAFPVLVVALLFFFFVNSGHDFNPTRDNTQKLIGEVAKTNFLISLYITVQTIRWGFRKTP